MLNIIDYQLPERSQNYIVLESISSNTSKVIHVINMTNTVKLYIGRGHDAHVRVTDISVSRLHAVLIKSVEGFYYLTDNDSKFGTLALVRTPLQLLPDQKTQLQIGRSLLSVEVRDTIQNVILQCLCMNQKESNRQSILDSNEAISLDGIDYFPKEFASQAYIQLMQQRKVKQLRIQKSKQKSPQVANHITTQNNESAMDPVDQYINFQNNIGTAALLSAEDANQQQISEFSDSYAEEEDERDVNFDQELQLNQVLDNQHPNGQQDQDLSPNQSGDIEENSQLEEHKYENERIDQEEIQQIEQAIQQSLLLHQQQTQVDNLKPARIIADQVSLHQYEEEKAEVLEEQDEEQKQQAHDYFIAKNTTSSFKKQLQLLQSQTQPNEDQNSQISTQRAIINHGYELRSSNFLLKPTLTKTMIDPPNFDSSDQANSQLDELGQHSKDRQLQFQLQLSQDSNFTLIRSSSNNIKQIGKFENFTVMGSPLVLPKRITIPQTSRNGANHDIAREIILEQVEDQHEEMHNNQVEHETIDQQIPFSATEVQPLQQI